MHKQISELLVPKNMDKKNNKNIPINVVLSPLLILLNIKTNPISTGHETRKLGGSYMTMFVGYTVTI